MTGARAWQELRTPPGALQRISCVELDLAATASGAPRLEYVPFAAGDLTSQMAQVAELMSQFGPQAPTPRSLLVVARGEEPERFTSRYPALPAPRHEGGTVLSADAGEVALLAEALKAGRLTVRGKRPEASSDTLQRVLDVLWDDERLLFVSGGKHDFRTPWPDDRIDLLYPMSRSGALFSEGVRDLRPDCAFNGGYFLWLDEELQDPYSFSFDSVGLVVRDGRVLNPPLYRRCALIVSTAMYRRGSDEARYSLKAPRVTIQELSLDDVAIAIGTEPLVRGVSCDPRRLPRAWRSGVGARTNPASVAPDQAAFYTRLLGVVMGHGRTSLRTPPARDRLECVIVGTEICSIKVGGETFIPPNGFVLSLPARLRSRVESALESDRHVVSYALDAGVPAWSAIQVGPRLARNGEPLDVGPRLDAGDEEFVALEDGPVDGGVPPYFLTRNRLLDARDARLALGVRSDARCYVALAEGCEPRTALPECDSEGATAEELTRFLLDLGCSDVVQLDGGGSAALSFEGDPIAKGADRHDIPFVARERVVPGAWCYWGSCAS